MSIDKDIKKSSTQQQELPVESMGTNIRIEAIGDVSKKMHAQQLQKDLIKAGAGNEKFRLQADQDVETALSDLMRKKIQEGRYMKYKNEKKIQDFETITDGKKISELNISEILLLKRRNVDLARLLLVKEANHTEEFSSSALHMNDSFVANFGDNKDFDAALGAGDILPFSVTEVLINGQKGIRKILPRPGFYTSEGKYLPIYDGYKIKILTINSIKEEEMKQYELADKKHFDDMRIEDLVENDYKSTDLVEDKELLSRAKDEIERRKLARKKYESYCSKEGIHRQEEFMNTFGDVVKTETEKYGIPQEVLLRLFYKESKFDPLAKNGEGSTAFGLGQILKGTWIHITRNILNDSTMDRYNPEHQIKATCAYLDSIQKQKSCSWGDVVVYYHTGPAFGDKNVESAWGPNKKALLPFLPDGITFPRNAQDYMAAARGYYGVDDFSNKGGITAGPILTKAKEIVPQGEILYIGDSIAVGLGGNKWSCAVEGRTTDYILKQVTELQSNALKGKTVVIHCGTNDVVNNSIQITSSIRNIEEISRICREKGAINVKVCVLSAFSDSSKIQYNNRVTDFNTQLSKIDTKNDIKLVPVNAITRNAGDGVHYANNNLQEMRNIAARV